MADPNQVELSEVNDPNSLKANGIPTASSSLSNGGGGGGGGYSSNFIFGGTTNSGFNGIDDEGPPTFYNDPTATPSRESIKDDRSDRSIRPKLKSNTNTYTVNRDDAIWPSSRPTGAGTSSREGVIVISSGKTNRRCCASDKCLKITIPLVVVLAVIVGVGLGLGLGLGLSKSQGNPIGSTTLNFAETLNLEGTLRINITWNYELNDPSTSAYRLLNSQVYSAVSWIFYNSSYYDAFVLYNDINFSPGSVLAVFRLSINVTGETPSDILTLLKDGFRTLLDQGLLPWTLNPDVDIWITDLSRSTTTPSVQLCTSSFSPNPTTPYRTPQMMQVSCVPLPSSSACSSLGYSSTGFPNDFGVTNASVAQDSFSQMFQLLTTRGCYNYTLAFTCASTFQRCVGRRLIPPCQDFCQDVSVSCSYPLSCSVLPDDDDPDVCQLSPDHNSTPPTIVYTRPCASALFLCSNDRCINKSAVCDGVDNCGDFSDELRCNPLETSSLDCDFETGTLCNYCNAVENDYNWVVMAGPSDSSVTGPPYDHTKRSSTGHYALADASGVQFMDGARLVSMPLSLTVSYCLRFYYFMYGDDVYQLQVIIVFPTNETSVWSQREDQGPVWRFGHVQLPMGYFKVVFEATRGTSYRSDIAIDDITARPGTCEQQACTPDEFECRDGSCILWEFVCNTRNDCGDYSDEENCTCSKMQFRCDMGMCIDGWRRCDGVIDCPDRSDEIDCVCPMGQYQCRNGTCIMAEWLCDRQKDCPDGEDESNCGNCSSNQFQCRDYSCIDIKGRCNGTYECDDHSDEYLCVRQDADLVIEGLSQTVWLPFCSESVPDYVCTRICLSLGMSGLTSRDAMSLNNSLYFIYNSNQTDNETALMASFYSGNRCANDSVLLLQCAAKVCGVSQLDSSPQGYIVHGMDALPGRWPWQVAIYKNLVFICGGSLIDENHVITAAHCVVDTSQTYTIFLGSYLRTQLGATGVIAQVQVIEIHPKYESYYWGYDVAILTLRNPVAYTDYIRPICITEPYDNVALSSICYSTGWGLTDFNRSNYLPEILQQAKMKLWSFEDCQNAYPFVTPLMLCSGYNSGYIANCPGDSGGPLVCKDSRGFWKIVGVFSFLTNGCNVPMKPSVFTNVQEFYSWIEDEITCKFYCNNSKCIWDLSELCNGVDNCGDATDEITTCSPSISCTFEDSYSCGYISVVQTGLVTWTRKSGPASVNEGPIVDATYGNNLGHYMYASTGRSILLAPIYNQVEPHCLQLRLHMRAVTCGGLRIFIQPTTYLNVPPNNVTLTNTTALFEWPPEFCQGDLWVTITADIGGGSYLLGFDAYTTYGQVSVAIAIDNVDLLSGSCQSQECSTTEFTCVLDSVCVPGDAICNYYTDCLDESDEVNCTVKQYLCDFENYGQCGLEQSALDSMDWLLKPAIDANSLCSCPALDHTSASSQGNIYFICTLVGKPGDLARVSLPIKTLSTPGCFKMYFSMISQGRLKVDFMSGDNTWITAWSINAVNYSDWQLLQLVLPVGVRLIQIDGLIGVEADTATVSYIAIDDIGIQYETCSQPVCTVNEFACADGLCIYEDHVCDGLDDCSDGSDETPQLCVCTPESFQCNNGQCLQAHVRCNVIRNCEDDSDEFNCTNCNSLTEYKCVSDGKCKPRSTWCDGVIDCVDGSDEKPNCSCLPEQFRCKNGHCILSVEYCNGHADCSDGSDEPVGCSCVTAGLFRCNDGACISKGYQCNLVNDCDDRSDESNCTQFKCKDGSVISSVQRCDGLVDCSDAEDEQDCTCFATQFHCTAGGCIPRSEVCDGNFNCPDLSDETNCTCSPGVHFRCATGVCLPAYVRCDGINECGDYSDEAGCVCMSNQFHCTDGICIPSYDVCNFKDDCGDGSDELNCPCEKNELKCSDGKCIEPEWLCDGYPDCKDGSDELNCSNCTNGTQFTCRLDYTCIPLSWRCDGKVDCHDGSDETGCIVQKTVNGTTNVLYGYHDGSFYPVCSEYWTEEWSNSVCASLGSRDILAVGSMVVPSSTTFVALNEVDSSLAYNLTQLNLTADCPDRRAVRLSCLPSSCGIVQSTYNSIVPYIIRGDMSTEGQWPWAAALQYNGVYHCSAALVDSQWILTAAHCIVNPNNGFSLANVPQYFTARLGTTKQVGYSSTMKLVSFSRVVVHPQFNVQQNIQYNDIALLQLTDPVTYSDLVNPICLPVHPGRSDLCFAAGWGLTNIDDYSDTPTTDLRQAKLEIWPYSVCSESNYWGSGVTNDTQICAGYSSGYISMCQGDSGGPLMCRDLNNRWTLYGVVSTGTSDCGETTPAKPTLFTNVQFFMPWIQSVMGLYRR